MDKNLYIEKLKLNRPLAFQKYNYDLLPETFHATYKIPITCNEHGLFYQQSNVHLTGNDCPKCGIIKRAKSYALTTDEFVKKSRAKFGNRLDYSKTNYTRQDIDLTITCEKHGDLVMTPKSHMGSYYGCRKCDYEIPRINKRREYLEKAEKIHNNKYDYSKVPLVLNYDDTVEVICPEHGSFWPKLSQHVKRSTECIKCTRDANRLTTDKFIAKSRSMHGDRYDYSKVVYVTNASKVTITCPKHGDFIQRAASHLAGCKCKECFIEESRKSTEEFIKNAKMIHGDNYSYEKVNYLGNKRHVEIICRKHGSFWQKPNGHISGSAGCRLCMDSKGERSVELFLKKYEINYIREYRLLPHLYRFDFYLPDFNIYIEFNGLQHYKPVELFGGELGYLKTKERDEIKRNLVKQNKEHLVILTYLCFDENSVEKALIRNLKRIYKFWFVVNGKIKVFNDLHTGLMESGNSYRDLFE